MPGAFPRGMSVRENTGGLSLGWPRMVIKEALQPAVMNSDCGLA